VVTSLYPGSGLKQDLKGAFSDCLGICWKLGLLQENLPVAAPNWLNSGWILLVTGLIFERRFSPKADTNFSYPLYSLKILTVGLSQSSKIPSPVEGRFKCILLLNRSISWTWLFIFIESPIFPKRSTVFDLNRGRISCWNFFANSSRFIERSLINCLHLLTSICTPFSSISPTTLVVANSNLAISTNCSFFSFLICSSKIGKSIKVSTAPYFNWASFRFVDAVIYSKDSLTLFCRFNPVYLVAKSFKL